MRQFPKSHSLSENHTSEAAHKFTAIDSERSVRLENSFPFMRLSCYDTSDLVIKNCVKNDSFDTDSKKFPDLKNSAFVSTNFEDILKKSIYKFGINNTTEAGLYQTRAFPGFNNFTLYFLNMITRLISLSFFIVFLFPVFAMSQTVTEDQIAFTTPDAPWMIAFNSKNFDFRDQQLKPDNKSGYFLLSNEKEGFTVSLFIEPVLNCKTSAECHDFVWKTGNPKWGNVQNVVQSKIGDVSYFEFFRPTVQGQPLQLLDMYAEFVENGYWVDLHISKVQYKKEDHALFENLVKSVRFVSKNGKPATDFDKAAEAARKVSEDWMILWDSGKYKESYAGLSSSTKKVFDEKAWSEHWTTGRKPLGKLKSRKIIQIQMIKSLPNMPDGSGAIFWYLSSYENQERVIESFSVFLEKDGTWRVANYNRFE